MKVEEDEEIDEENEEYTTLNDYYACGMALLPFKSSKSGVAPKLTEEEKGEFGSKKSYPYGDIITESIKYFRINVLFKTFELSSKEADVTLFYLTVYISHLIKLLRKTLTLKEAEKICKDEAKKKIKDPGDKDFFMAGILQSQKDEGKKGKKKIGESSTLIVLEKMKKYLDQARRETGRRLCKMYAFLR